jgi:hypothetical protein
MHLYSNDGRLHDCGFKKSSSLQLLVKGLLPKWIITQQNHKIHKDGLFEQKLAKVTKFTDPDMVSEIGINSGFGTARDFSSVSFN